MKTFDEIENSIQNLEYYTDKIDKLTRTQYNDDCNNFINVHNMTDRLDLLGILGGATREVKLLCEQMRSNLNCAKGINITQEEQEELL